MNWIERIYERLFPIPSEEELIARELISAKRELLVLQSQRDYINGMIKYNEDRVKRLTNK